MREQNDSRSNRHNRKQKKSFYKKWWFWLIIVIFVAAGISNIFDPVDSINDNSAKESQVKKREAKKTSSKKDVKKTKRVTKSVTEKKKPKKASSSKKKETKSADNDTKKDNKQDQQKENQSMLESYAKSFGMKDAETVQKMVGSAYASQYIDGQGMTYAWHTQYGTLMRVDDTQNKITTVYLYDENNANGLGQVLYQGQTILQKAPKLYQYYN